MEPKAAELLTDEARRHLAALLPDLEQVAAWSAAELEAALKAFVSARETKLGMIAQPLRAALTGRTASPGIYDLLTVLGREESLLRIGDLIRI